MDQESIDAIAQAIAKALSMTASTPTNSGNIPFPKYKEGDNITDFCLQFEGLATVHNFGPEKKKASFLALLPPTTFKLLKNLLFPKSFANTDYEVIKKTLVTYLKPTPLRIPSRHALITRRQREGESIAEYMGALRALAIPCAYQEDVLKEVLKDVFVAGIRSRSILDRLFVEPDTADLDKLYNTALAIDKAEASSAKLLAPLPVNKLKLNTKKSDGKPVQAKGKAYNSGKKVCLACGKENHIFSECRNKEKLSCTFCKKSGHIEKVCMTKKKAYPIHKITNVEGPWYTTLQIEGQTLKFELDTGSPVTLIPESIYRKLTKPPSLERTNDIFKPYVTDSSLQSSIIAPLGVTSLHVTYNNKSLKLPAYIVKGQNEPLIGRQWLLELGIIDIHNIRKDFTTDTLQAEFPTVFSPGIGLAKEVVTLKLKQDATPVFCKTRPAPYALKTAIENELQKLVEEGILEPVEASDWATPIVPVMKNGKLRICADYSRSVNPNIEIPTYPIPRTEELLSNIRNGKIFSKIDIRKAYLCLPVDEPTSAILTLNTHKGLFRPKRLMFGVAAAPVIWTKFIEKVTRGIPEMATYFDDLLLAAPDANTMTERLRIVLQRLQEYGLRINPEKSSFYVDSVSYLGQEVSARGIRPLEERLEPIRKLTPPENVSQLRTFLGMISFYSKYFPKMATIAAPLYNLTKKQTKFHWSKECQHSFETLKNEITSDRVLVPYDPSRPIVLSTDASPTGAGATLSHVYEDGSERPITYIHKKFCSTQVNYSQIDKEAYAIKWAVEKLHQYLIGRQFTLITDHKPLLYIFGNQRKRLPVLTATRLLHYALFLHEFDFIIKYRKAEEHGNADFLSRLPSSSKELPITQELDETDDLHINNITLLPFNPGDLAKETLRDPFGRELIQKLRDGVSLGDQEGLYTLQNGCVLRGIRTYIPPKFRNNILTELHEGHLGIVKMKALARSYVFWPNIDQDIERLCRECHPCSLHKGRPLNVKKHYWEYPMGPWERIHADFAIYGKTIYLIIVDAHSKWPEIHILQDMNSNTIIKIFDNLIVSYGTPKTLVTDNQSSLVSYAMQRYLQRHNIKHLTIPPYHAATNGLAERMVGALKQCLRTLQYGSGTTQEKLYTFLRAYRRAPHSSTGISPAMLFLKREIRTNLDMVRPQVPPIIAKRQEATFMDPMLHEGESVAVRSFVNPLHKWKKGTIVARDGQLQYTVLIDGELHRKHVEHLRRVGDDTSTCQVQTANYPSIVLPEAPVPTPASLVPESTAVDKSQATSSEFIEIPPVQESTSEQATSPTRDSTNTIPGEMSTSSTSVIPEEMSLAERRPRRQIRRPARYDNS